MDAEPDASAAIPSSAGTGGGKEGEKICFWLSSFTFSAFNFLFARHCLTLFLPAQSLTAAVQPQRRHFSPYGPRRVANSAGANASGVGWGCWESHRDGEAGNGQNCFSLITLQVRHPHSPVALTPPSLARALQGNSQKECEWASREAPGASLFLQLREVRVQALKQNRLHLLRVGILFSRAGRIQLQEGAGRWSGGNKTGCGRSRSESCEAGARSGCGACGKGGKAAGPLGLCRPWG